MSAHHHHSRKRSSSRTQPKKDGPRREHIEELHPCEDVPDIETFDEWDLNEEIQRAIRNMDITKPTPIQALAIGPVLEGKDVIAKAETGTGKTLAFGAPMMSNMDVARSTVLGLVLCPTRELAQQVADVLKALGLPRGLQVALIVGGDPMQPQIAQLHAGAQVVVGTPGRVLDLYEQRFLSFPWTEVAILDEADKMFEIGFLDDIKKILSYLPDERQTLLFSATFPTEVLKLARESTNSPVELATQRGLATVSNIDQFHIKLNSEDRPMALMRLMEQSDEKDIFLVFCERRTDVDRLLRRLERLPFEIKALHGGYDQPSRFRVMSAYRTGEVKALIATDVASRGLDVNHVTHVINFGVPRELEDYTHRIGRTGRAGRHGTAITFVPPEDARRWKSLEQGATWDIAEMEAPGRYKRRESPPERSANAERGERPERNQRDRDERPARPERGRDERPERSRSERPERPRREREERPAREERSERPSRERDERPAREERSERPSRGRDERPAREERSERPRRDREEPSSSRISPTAGAPLSRWARASDDEVARRRAERANERGDAPREQAAQPEAREEQPRERRPRRQQRSENRGGAASSERPRERSRGERDERPQRQENSERPERRPRADRDAQADERPRRGRRDRQREDRPEREERSVAERRPRREQESERETPGFGSTAADAAPKPRSEAPAKPPTQSAPKPQAKPEKTKPSGPSFGTGL